MKRIYRSFLLLLTVILIYATPIMALEEGNTVSNINVRDASNRPAAIPDLGKKVVLIFYTDPDVADQNDPLADALSDANLKKEKFRGMGVVNLKDTWIPNPIIRKIVRGKIEKYDSTILTDPDRLLSQKWNLGDCNEKSVIIVIDKGLKVRFLKKGPIRGAEVDRVVKLVRDLSEA